MDKDLSNGSSRKYSTSPFTNGSSGPTTTISIACSIQQVRIASKSVTPNGKCCPNPFVPALPGAINNALQRGLWVIFQANACSLPPEPNNSILMIKGRKVSCESN